jgi:hypothetical protein
VDYAYVYNTGVQTVSLESAIIFATNGPITSAFTFTPLSSGITINVTGIYEAAFTIIVPSGCQFALALNGVAIAGSTYGTIVGGPGVGAGDTGRVTFIANAGQVLTLINHTSTNGNIVLPILAGGTVTNVNASIYISRIA